MDVDPSSVRGESDLNDYIRVQQLSNDTDLKQCGACKESLVGSSLDTTRIGWMWAKQTP